MAKPPKLPILARNKPSKGSKGVRKEKANERKSGPFGRAPSGIHSSGAYGMFPKGGK